VEKENKTKIKNLVLRLREDFEKEIDNGLNKHGIYVDKEWKDGRSLTHLSKQELENRNRIAAFIKRQETAGTTRAEATREFIKEASYTWINRLLGLKCMEVRGLLDEEVITTRSEYGGRSLRHRNFLEEHSEFANAPDDGLIACFFEVFKEITEEIKVLFDTNSEYSLILPRYAFLKQAIDLINSSIDYYTYKEDEFLGWVYQYFQTKEKDRIFENVYKKKKKISGSDIIPATSLYTEKYMVRFLVENSLGAIWMEMYPDSQLNRNWEYFVKDPNNTTREKKPVKEIKILDPACGSGHFLLYAFDLFYQMYKEEGIVPEKEIIDYILKYNLHGIDIDLRSVQLSALGLWMKAKSKNPDIKINQMNLVAANAVMVNGDRLTEFLEVFGTDELAKELVKTIWRGLQNIRELGSLLKVEEQIDEVIERNKKQMRVDLYGREEAFTWERWKQRIMDKLRNYMDKAMQFADINKEMFANETIKGLNFIDLISQKYDVVATNPPYMHKRNMNSGLKELIKRRYYGSDLDLYSAFIDRNLQLIGNDGFVAMITQQTFMFIKKYEKLRKKLFESYFFRTMAHLGPHAFEDISGEKVNTTMFILSNKKYGNGVYFKLTDDLDKSSALLLNNKGKSEDKYVVTFETFKHIGGYPFIYWINNNIRDLFINLNPLDDYSEIKQGLATGDNNKYLRFFWEINESNSKLKWRPYAKGGKFNKWFTNIDLIINWDKSAINQYRKTQFAQIYVSKNADRYLSQDCLTYTMIGGKSVSMRFLGKGSVTDVSGSSIFSTEYSLNYLIGFLNSKLDSFILSFLNPTLSFQVGDLKRIPFYEPPSQTEQTVSLLANDCISIKKSILQFIINDREYKWTAIQYANFVSPNETKIEKLYKIYLNHIEEEYVKLYTYEAMIDKEIFALYEIEGDDLEQILREQGTPAGYFPIIEGYELSPNDMLPEVKEYIKGLERKELSADELNKVGEKLKELYESSKTLEEISIELQINPFSIAAMRKEADLINTKDLKHEVENLLTYYILEELKKDKDGIIPITDNTAETPLAKRLIDYLEKMFGEENIENVLAEIKEILDKDLDSWLSMDFFGKHVSQYKKRPIIWHLHSREKSFECLLYYHRVDADMLQKLKNIYLSKALEINRYRLGEQKEVLNTAEGKGKQSIYTEIERLEAAIENLEDLDKRIESILRKGYNPVIDDGVMVNIAPLQEAEVLSRDILSKSEMEKAFELADEMRRERE